MSETICGYASQNRSLFANRKKKEVTSCIIMY